LIDADEIGFVWLML